MIGNERGLGESGAIAVPGPGSMSEQEATVTYAMTPMGMAATPGNCVLGSIRNLSNRYLSSEAMRVRHGLWQFDAL